MKAVTIATSYFMTVRCIPHFGLNSFIFIPEVMKTGLAKLNFLGNFSQLPLSNISLFTVLFTADVGCFLLSLACFLVRDLFSSGCRHN